MTSSQTHPTYSAVVVVRTERRYVLTIDAAGELALKPEGGQPAIHLDDTTASPWADAPDRDD